MFRLTIMALAFAQSLPLTLQTGKLSGKVTDAITHQPLQNARISAELATRSVATRTAADGTYTFENVPPGLLHMTVRLEGYSSVYPGMAEFQFDLRTTEVHDFELHPLSRIHGTLIDHDTGDPIQGHLVLAVHKVYVPGHSFVFPTMPDPRDPNDKPGEFHFAGLDAGDYRLEIDATNEAEIAFLSDDAAPQTHPQKYYGQRWYPDVPSMDMATVIHLIEGESRDLEISLRSHQTYTLSGTIEPPRGSKNQAVVFVFRTSAPTGRQTRQMAAPGPFRIGNLVPGTYRLAITSGAAPNESMGEFSFEIIDHDVDNFKAVLMPIASISGDVHMLEQDVPLPTKLSVFLVPTSGWYSVLPHGFMIDGLSSNSGAPVESGKFHKNSLQPGEYWPQLMGLPKGYAFMNTPSINLSAPDTILNFVVTSRPGAASGVLRDDNQAPVRGTSVLLIQHPLPENAGSTAIHTAESGADGTFLFKDLAPGKYKAVTLPAGDGAQFGDTESLRALTSKVEPFEVHAGELVSISLRR